MGTLTKAVLCQGRVPLEGKMAVRCMQGKMIKIKMAKEEAEKVYQGLGTARRSHELGAV